MLYPWHLFFLPLRKPPSDCGEVKGSREITQVLALLACFISTCEIDKRSCCPMGVKTTSHIIFYPGLISNSCCSVLVRSLPPLPPVFFGGGLPVLGAILRWPSVLHVSHIAAALHALEEGSGHNFPIHVCVCCIPFQYLEFLERPLA